MGALLPRRMSTEPAPSSPESSDSRKRRSLLALSSVTRKPAAAANAALREEVQQALAADPALLEPLLAALPAEALQLALAAVRRRRPAAAEESEGDAATAIQSVYRGHASRRRESLASEAHRCLVFGSLNMDLHAVTGQKWPRAGHIVTLTHGHFVANPGGKGANEAVALARLGIDVRLVGYLTMAKSSAVRIQAKLFRPALAVNRVRHVKELMQKGQVLDSIQEKLDAIASALDRLVAGGNESESEEEPLEPPHSGEKAM